MTTSYLQTTSMIQINIIMLLSVCLTSGCICHDNVTLPFQCLDRHVVCKHTDETPDGEHRPVQRNARKNSLGVWTGSQKGGCAASASLPQDEWRLSQTYEVHITFDQQMNLGQWLYPLNHITTQRLTHNVVGHWLEILNTDAVLQIIRSPRAATEKKMRIQLA